MASQWGVRDKLATDIVDLPGFQGTLRVVEGLEPVDRGDLAPVPWMRCEPCGRVLALEHRQESWGAVWRSPDKLTATCREAAATEG